MQTPPLERLADSLPIHRDAVRIFWAICTSLLSAGSRRFRRQESKCEDHVPESLGGFTKFAPGLKCPALVRNAIRTCGFVLGMAFFASCYAQSPIVGKWQEVAPKTETLEFFKDGTVSVVNPAESISAAGKYSFIDKDRIKMELGGAIGELIGPQIMRVAVSGDEMKLIGLDGEVSVYNRAGSAKAIAQPDVTTMVFTNFISAVQRGDTPAAIQLTHSHMTAVKQTARQQPEGPLGQVDGQTASGRSAMARIAGFLATVRPGTVRQLGGLRGEDCIYLFAEIGEVENHRN